MLCVLQGLSTGALDTGGSLCLLRLHGSKVDPWMQANSFFFAIGTTVHINSSFKHAHVIVYIHISPSSFPYVSLDIAIHCWSDHRRHRQPQTIVHCNRYSHLHTRNIHAFHATVQIGARHHSTCQKTQIRPQTLRKTFGSSTATAAKIFQRLSRNPFPQRKRNQRLQHGNSS